MCLGGFVWDVSGLVFVCEYECGIVSVCHSLQTGV